MRASCTASARNSGEKLALEAWFSTLRGTGEACFIVLMLHLMYLKSLNHNVSHKKNTKTFLFLAD